MQPGIWQIVLIAVIVLLLFGRGKISALMGDVARGITSFKKGLKDPDESAEPLESVSADSSESGESASSKSKSTD